MVHFFQLSFFKRAPLKKQNTSTVMVDAVKKNIQFVSLKAVTILEDRR